MRIAECQDLLATVDHPISGSSFIYNAKMKRNTYGKEAACMRRKKSKPNYRKVVLRLPDLDHAKASVLNSLSSPKSRRNYRFAMDQFIAWYCSEPCLALNRTVVQRFRLYLESLGLAAATINQRLAAVRRRLGTSGLTVFTSEGFRICHAPFNLEPNTPQGRIYKRNVRELSGEAGRNALVSSQFSLAFMARTQSRIWNCATS
jgi:hypothetical protein